MFLSPDSIQRELFEVDQKERISMSELSNESSEGNQSAWSWPQSNIHYEHSPWLTGPSLQTLAAQEEDPDMYEKDEWEQSDSESEADDV